MIALDSIVCMDALELCAQLKPASIDCAILDVPYAVTNIGWDKLIPLMPMWEALRRVMKPKGAIIHFSCQPFTTDLIVTARDLYRYEIIWHKNRPTRFLDAKYNPLRTHENIQVFGLKRPHYYPQKALGQKKTSKKRKPDKTTLYKSDKGSAYNSEERYPTSVWYYPMSTAERGLHVTQKPLALIKQLALSFSKEGETLLDFACGSGTVALAAHLTGRHYICGDISPEYVEIARNRLQNSDAYQAKEVNETYVQPSLFDQS